MKKRIVKKSEERKKEIIQAAQVLFDKHGYENTSVAQIIESISISKGAFYHHFSGKQEVLMALVDTIGSEMKSLFLAVVNTPELAAMEKLKLLLRGKEKNKTVEQSTMQEIHKSENRELQERLNRYAVEHIAPLMAQVIEQGNQEGVFHAKNPLEAMQLLMASSLFIFDSGVFDWPSDKKDRLLQAMQSLFETSLGATEGSLAFIASPS